MNIESLYIEITNQCNLNCKDCYNASGISKEFIEISPEALDKFISQMSALTDSNDFSVILSGGEPLCHSKWLQILDVVIKHSKNGINISIVSNATIKDERLYDLLENNEKFFIQFSIDGCDEDTNAKTRGEGNFDISMKNINSTKYANPPTLKMVASQYNKHQIEDYYRFVTDMGFMPNFSFINHMGNATSDWDNKKLSALEKVNIVKMVERLNKEFGLETQPPYATLLCPLAQPAGMPLSLLIKPNGDIQPCQMFYDESVKLCSIYDFTDKQFISSFDDLRSLLKAREEMDFGCSKCICASQCRKGCPAHALSYYGKLDVDDTGCSFRKTQIAKLVVLDMIKKGNICTT